MPDRGPASLVVCAGVVAACQSSSFFPLPELPPGIVLVGAYLANEDGSIASSTPLHPAGAADLRLELSSDGEVPEEELAVRVVGYSEADLARVGGPPAADLPPTRLYRATGCSSVLPEPSQSTWLGERTAPEVPLSVEWLEGRCPSVLRDRSMLVDPSCAQPHCGQVVTIRGCEIAVDLPRCGLPSLSGIIQADGTVCLGQPDGICERRPSRDLETPMAECLRSQDRCQLRFVPSAPLELGLATLRTYPEVAPRVFDADSRLAASYAETFVGYVTDFELIDEQVVLLGHAGAWFVPFERQPLPGTELRYHDLSDLGLIRTATVAGWGLRIDRNPLAETLLLTTRTPEGYFLIELDLEGRELRRVLLASVSPQLPFELFPVGSFPLSSEGLHVTVFDDADPTRSDEMVSVNLETWAIEARSELTFGGRNGRPRVAWPFDGELIVYADLAVNAMVFASVRDGILDQPMLLGLDVMPLNNYPMGMLPMPERGLVLQTFSGPVAGLAAYSRTALQSRASYFEARADVTAMERVRHRPEVALVSVETGVEGDRSAHVGLFDLERLEFMPGRRQVSFGPANRTRSDRDGAIWVLYPWAGEVVRLAIPE